MPSIGKDLQKIRQHLRYSIEDVQHHTKIPVDTLRRIESDAIFEDSEENLTYVRSFVRSYGRALKISDDLMIKALDQFETGNYNHLLLQQFPELSSAQAKDDRERPMAVSEEPSDKSDEKDQSSAEVESAEEPDLSSSETTRENTDDELPLDVDESTDTTGSAEKASAETGRKEQKDRPEVEKSVSSVDWADVGRKFTEEKKRTPVWIIALIILLVMAAIAGYFLYQGGYINFADDTHSESTPVNTTNSPEQRDLNLTLPAETEPEQDTERVALDDTLFVTVYAATERLDPVRVWSDLKPRMDPYWLNQGTAMRFEFQDTIRIRGPYERMLLFIDGHRIENPDADYYSEPNNYVELTRSLFADDPKWATSIPLELPEGIPAPDSVTNRPTFP